MASANVLEKSSVSEIMKPKFEMCLRNNERRSEGDSKYRSIFLRTFSAKF